MKKYLLVGGFALLVFLMVISIGARALADTKTFPVLYNYCGANGSSAYCDGQGTTDTNPDACSTSDPYCPSPKQVSGVTCTCSGHDVPTETFGSGAFSCTGPNTQSASCNGFSPSCGSCQPPSVTYAAPTIDIDPPINSNGLKVSGTINIHGWALDNNTSPSSDATAITSFTYTIDGGSPQSGGYGVDRPDVCGVYPGVAPCPKPANPNGSNPVGYSFNIDTTQLSNGNHIISITAADSDPSDNSATTPLTIDVQNQSPTITVPSCNPTDIAENIDPANDVSTCTATASDGKGVTWSASGGNGSITSGGIYTSGSTSGPVTVQACLVSNGNTCQTTTINVHAPSGSISVNPASCTQIVGLTCDDFLTWSTQWTPSVSVVATPANSPQYTLSNHSASISSFEDYVISTDTVNYELEDSQGNPIAPATFTANAQPIPGQCGNDANNGTYYTPAQASAFSQNPDMCSAGSPSKYPLSGAGPWSWTCSGQYNGAPSGACDANTTQSGSCSLNSQSLSFVATKGDGGDQSQNITIQNTSPVTVTVTPQVVNAPGWFSLDNKAPQSIPAHGSFNFAAHAKTGAWGAGSYVFPDPSAVPAQSFDFLVSGGSEPSCNQSYAASVSFTVVPAAKTLTGITVNPPNPTVTVGNTQAFTATGHYSDGSTADLTGVATWGATDVVNGTNVATYVGNPAGTFKAQHVGQTNVTAAIHGVTTVTSPNDLMTVVAPATCSVNPANLAFTATVNDGQTQTQTITVENTSGFKVTVTPQLTGQVPGWFSISPATQQTMDANGQATFTVKAITGSTAQGSHSYSFDFLMAGTGGNGGASCNSPTPASVNFTVNSGSGNGGYSITVSPSNPSVQVGQTQTFTAVETDPSGNQSNITNTATWTSSNNADASNVGNSSTFTAHTVNTQPNIIAADSHASGQTTMNIVAPNNISLVVLPSQTVWVGTTIKVIASGGSGSFTGWNVQPPGSIAPGPNGNIGGPGGDTLSGSFANFSNPVYTVSVHDQVDPASTASTNLNVVSPVCPSFTGTVGSQTADTLTIVPPQNVKLTWFCNTTPVSNLIPTCTLSDTNSNTQTVIASGNLTENVSKKTTFTLTCQGNGSGPNNQSPPYQVIVNTTGAGIHEGAP